VIYITGEEFTNKFLQALNAGKLGGLRKQFRDCHGLLLDNLHFLARKPATQEEFLHTFETLQKRGRPVVVSCDCHPKMIPQLMPELADRLLGGGVYGLEAPDKETRTAILTAKAARLGSRLSEEVVDFLAQQLRGNVRELEGALHSIRHYSLSHGEPITLKLAREATGDLIRHTKRVIQLKEIERALCAVLNMEGRLLHGKGRTRAASHPRMLAMYLARKHTPSTYGDIGGFFGGRNHSTAIAAEKKVTEWIEENSPLFIHETRWMTKDLMERVERELLN
jgi:chromosomal replication initiator protein